MVLSVAMLITVCRLRRKMCDCLWPVCVSARPLLGIADTQSHSLAYILMHTHTHKQTLIQTLYHASTQECTRSHAHRPDKQMHAPLLWLQIIYYLSLTTISLVVHDALATKITISSKVCAYNYLLILFVLLIKSKTHHTWSMPVHTQ